MAAFTATALTAMGMSAAAAATTASVVSAVGTGLAVAGAVGGAYSSMRQGREQVKQLRFKQDQLTAKSNLEAMQQAKRDKAFRSTQMAQIGKSGVQLSDSALNLVQRTAAEQEIDVLTRKYNTQVGISDLDQEISNTKFEAKSAATQQLLKIPTILGGTQT